MALSETEKSSKEKLSGSGGSTVGRRTNHSEKLSIPHANFEVSVTRIADCRSVLQEGHLAGRHVVHGTNQLHLLLV